MAFIKSLLCWAKVDSLSADYASDEANRKAG